MSNGTLAKIEDFRKKLRLAEDDLVAQRTLLEEAQKKAKEEFGTSDVEELRQLCLKWDKELEQIGNLIEDEVKELEEGYDWSVIDA